MAITEIYAYLVHPNKKTKDKTRLNGSNVGLSGDLFKFLSEIFHKSEAECDIEVALVPTEDGNPKNEFRDCLLDFSLNGTLECAEKLAFRLGEITTLRSGLGLFFIVREKTNSQTRTLLSRFPTERAIAANEKETGLDVAYLEQVFLKNARTYKAALFVAGSHGRSDLWEARIVDKQINSIEGEASRYWVRDFLNSDFKTTPSVGTRRLARAILDASRKGTYEVKEELHFAAGLAKRFNGQLISINDFAEKLGLTTETKRFLLDQVQPSVAQDKFLFNSDEYGRTISYRAIELSNGALVTAPSADFQTIIQVEKVGPSDDRRVRISTEGILLADKLTKAKT